MRCHVLDFIVGSMCVGLLLGFYGYASSPVTPEQPRPPQRQTKRDRPARPDERHHATIQMLDFKDRKKLSPPLPAKHSATARPATIVSNPPTVHASAPRPPSAVAVGRDRVVSKTKPKMSSRTPLDLPSVLPSAAAKIYRQRLAIGLKLIEDGVTLPEYSTVMSQSVIDDVLSRGLAKLVVVAGPKDFFVFRGVLTSPGRPRLAVQDDFQGFSQRAVSLHGEYTDRLARAVSTEFRYPPERLAAAIVLRRDLDAGVLAAQDQAAQALSLELKQVVRTEGVFQTIQNVPFAYIVHTVLTRDGRRLRYDPDSSVHAVADDDAIKSTG